MFQTLELIVRREAIVFGERRWCVARVSDIAEKGSSEERIAHHADPRLGGRALLSCL